jgi:hypothetical protein
MNSRTLLCLTLAVAALAFAPFASGQVKAPADAPQTKNSPAKKTAQSGDLQIKKNISVGGNVVSSSETSIHGARERVVNGPNITLRQCDMKRSITLNDQAQTYMVTNDPTDESTSRAAALAMGAPEDTSGKIAITTSVTDTGERKLMFGYPARHLKVTVAQESSENACSKVNQKFEIDGWYAEIGKDFAACSAFNPPVQQAQGCNDRIVKRLTGSGKLAYPLVEHITFHNGDAAPVDVMIETSEISKQPLEPTLFDVPANYTQVNSVAELKGAGAAPQQTAQQTPQQVPPTGMTPQMQQPYGQPPAQNSAGTRPGLTPAMQQVVNNPSPTAKSIAGQQAIQQTMAQYGMSMGQPLMGPNGGQQMPPGGMPGFGQPPAGAAAVAGPKVLGPKAVGKIRIGVAPPDAQVGQGNNAQADYSTPIRNSIVLLMDGPAVEVAALDARIPMQLQAEAQQKQCDFILYSSVTVKHSSGGGFGKMLKMAGPIASMTPMGGMAKGMGGAVAAQAASAAASAAAMSAQQQAMNQLAGFDKEIKSKDDVAMQYQLVATGQSAPRLQDALKVKAKSDGEDVLTPLLTQVATNVLTEATKKQ